MTLLQPMSGCKPSINSLVLLFPSLHSYIAFALNWIYSYTMCAPSPLLIQSTCLQKKQLKFQFSSLQLNLFFFFFWELIICLACFWTLGVLHWVSQFQPLGAHNWLGESSTQTDHTLMVGEVLSQRLAKRAMAVELRGGGCPAWLVE